jgi:hypothetical protein
VSQDPKAGLPVGWRLVTEAEEQAALVAELSRELETNSGHPLAAQRASAIARRIDNDDVLFELMGGRMAVVHLTYARECSAEWPVTTVFEDAQEWRRSCHEESQGSEG